MEQKFKELVSNSKKVLITSHITPDLDAIASSLLLAEILRANISGPQFRHVLEEHPGSDHSDLHNYRSVEFAPMLTTLESYKPDLLIIVDANNYGRISRNESEQVRDFVAKNKIKTIVIDHHQEVGKDDVDLFLNEHGPAAVQEVYRLCFTKLGMKKPEGYGEMTMLGLIGDTGRFKYANPAHHETFTIVDQLLDDGVSIEAIEDRLERYTPAQLKVLAELMVNLNSRDDYTFSYCSSRFRDKWISDQANAEDYKSGCHLFIDAYVRNIENRQWGFIVYPVLDDPQVYNVSFRASNDTKDVARIANLLGGGGHKPAAGAKFIAKSLDEALQKVHDAIKQVQ